MATRPSSLIPNRWLRLPRRSIRLRLTVLYGGLFLIAGAALLAITYALVASQPSLGGALIHITSGTAAPASACSHGSANPSAPPQAQLFPQPPNASQISSCMQYGKSVALAQQAKTLRLLLTTSGIALGIMTVVSIALGWLMAGRVLGPLRTITAAARQISASNLHERLALTGPDDELKELGDTFDGLLGRLEASFRAQRQFVANASHELRTPLARQQTVLEVALADPEPTVDALQAVCKQVLAAGVQQERLIEALLTLARSERGLDRSEPVDLAAITAEVLLTRGDEARLRDVRIESALDPAMALGDSRLAERLVTNLVDNALRHNVPGGNAEVATGTSAGRATLSVTNTGPVVPQDQVARLFEPFQRLEGQRTATRDGLGLGLPIATAIATAHGAELRAYALRGGGLTVTVWFPPLIGQPTVIGARQAAAAAVVA
jgi:signal transduction histidine kinase